MENNDLLSLTVRNKKGIVFQGEAKSVTSLNEIGWFDILPKHAHFITMIKEKLVIGIDRQEKREIPVVSGILRVWNNEVKAFLDKF